MGEMADLWDKKFAGKFSKEPEVNKYLIELNHTITEFALLLKEAHDKLDDYNASKNEPLAWHSCHWCNGQGYDGNGLDHDEDCILVKIRHVIHT